MSNKDSNPSIFISVEGNPVIVRLFNNTAVSVNKPCSEEEPITHNCEKE